MRTISYEDLETEGYLLKEDAKSIEDYARKNAVMVSFRNAGSATLNQLKRGAAAKGHDILDKTIKAKSLGIDTNTGGTGDIVTKLNEALLSAMKASKTEPHDPDIYHHIWDKLGGLVASWKGNVPQALYLSKLGRSIIPKSHLSQCTVIRDSKGEHQVLVLENSLPIITDLLHNHGDEFYRFFYTGDYDMHDLVQTIGVGRSIIPSESPDETRVIHGMNHAIFDALAADTSERHNRIRRDSMDITINEVKRDDQEYQMIRHGAQVSYLAHMLAEESTEAVIYTVADQTHNEEIAAYSVNGDWVLLNPVTELKTWYKKNGVRLKMTWKNDVHLKEAIAAGIANQIYREIQTARHNKVSDDWLISAVRACVIADSQVTREITALTITLLTSGSGARLRKTADGYETTVFMVK